LELTTHAVFAFVVGLIFFGRPDAALLVTLGALLPDLDREYWFVRLKTYQDEQPHRARFHNVFVMAAGCLLSPFFALGIFLHALQDSFTTVKDRGCEWFYPLTRIVKFGTYDADGNPQQNIEPGKIYFYQEDVKGIIEKADPDLRIKGDDPTPWRRTYGFALNSCLLDRGFLIGSIALAIIWLAISSVTQPFIFNKPATFYYPFVAAFAFFGLIYFAGELDRRDRKAPLKIIPKTMIRHNNIYKKPLFIAGIASGGVWIFLYRLEIWNNLKAIFNSWQLITMGAAAIAVLSLILVMVEQNAKKKKGEPVTI
jgi:hypothetical protein